MTYLTCVADAQKGRGGEREQIWEKAREATLLLLVLPSQALKIVFVTHNKET